MMSVKMFLLVILPLLVLVPIMMALIMQLIAQHNTMVQWNKVDMQCDEMDVQAKLDKEEENFVAACEKAMDVIWLENLVEDALISNMAWLNSLRTNVFDFSDAALAS